LRNFPQGPFAYRTGPFSLGLNGLHRKIEFSGA